MQARRTTALAVTLAVAATAAVTAQGSVAAKPAKRADLVVSTVSAPPATAQPGTSISAKATVVSKGRVAAGASSLQFYLSKDKVRSADDVAGGVAKLQKIKPRKKQVASGSIAIPQDASGSYYVVACADSRKKVKETKEGNNCRTSATPVAVDGDIHGKLSGSLTFTQYTQTTSPSDGGTDTKNFTATASIAMTADGDPADPMFYFVSTGSTYQRSGSWVTHRETADCVQHSERTSSGGGALTYTGAPLTDDIDGGFTKTDLSEVHLGLDFRSSWTETRSQTGRGESGCETFSKTSTGGEYQVNGVDLKQVSRTGNTIQYAVSAWEGSGQTGASDWTKVEGTLTLTLS